MNRILHKAKPRTPQRTFDLIIAPSCVDVTEVISPSFTSFHPDPRQSINQSIALFHNQKHSSFFVHRHFAYNISSLLFHIFIFSLHIAHVHNISDRLSKRNEQFSHIKNQVVNLEGRFYERLNSEVDGSFPL